MSDGGERVSQSEKPKAKRELVIKANDDVIRWVIRDGCWCHVGIGIGLANRWGVDECCWLVMCA